MSLTPEDSIENQLVADFDAYQGWPDVKSAIDYCARQPNPDLAMRRIIDANLQMDEGHWAKDFLDACLKTGEWPFPPSILAAAAAYLPKQMSCLHCSAGLVVSNLNATGTFLFSEAEGRITARQLNTSPSEDSSKLSTASPTISAPRLAEFIERVVSPIT